MKENEELFNETKVVYETKYCLSSIDFMHIRFDKFGTD